MKILIADKISDRGINLLKATGWDVQIPTAATLPTDIADADGLIVRSATKVTPDLLEKAKKLRVIGRAGVGVDNVNMDAATRRGVLVMNTPGGNAVSVAEHTFALLLALTKQVPKANTGIHAGLWEKSSSGVELRGKTIGLVGFGRVGMEVAKRAKGFDMKVIAFDPYVSQTVAKELEVELISLEEVLRRADVLSMHTALSPSTEKIINAGAIAQMKKGARIINCARGELIDEGALAEALKSGHLAGAGLDTFAVEPPKNSPLIGMPNVVATPHIAGSTAEAQEEIGTLIAQQVKDYLSDGQIRNAVNMPSLSPDQYKRLGPYLELANRIGIFIAQAGASNFTNVKIRYSGEPAEVGSHVVRSAVLMGLMNAMVEEPVNLVNAAQEAAARGLVVEEVTRRRERGYQNTVEVTASSGSSELVVEGTVGQDGQPRILVIDGIELESPLEGTILITRNRDVPGVIGKIGTALGSLGVNIATFALGRIKPEQGADAIALVRLDGKVDDSAVAKIREIPSITDARLVRLPELAKAHSQAV
jgi:D-3-phosphoglycerate dehydrogenase / 2-oxoglutarate reductase